MKGFLKRLLTRIGHVQSLILLTVVYLVLWLPVGLVCRFSADWLRRKIPSGTNWWARDERVNRPETMREPF